MDSLLFVGWYPAVDFLMGGRPGLATMRSISARGDRTVARQRIPADAGGRIGTANWLFACGVLLR
jgi:hypothetical protein